MKQLKWLEPIVKPHLMAHLDRHQGNIARTARSLGAPLRSLDRWVTRLELRAWCAELRAQNHDEHQPNHELGPKEGL